jgi:hypothetical protein
MKHTKGPWISATQYNNDDLLELATKDNTKRIGFVDRIEDAHLIAAAPEMLEALEKLQMIIDLEDLEAVDLIAKAINKAKGGSE